MKITQTHISSRSRICLPSLSKRVLSLAAAVSLTGGALSAVAQTEIEKANSYTSLSTGSDWSGGVAPGATNIAVWDTGAGTPQIEPLGAGLALDGIDILSPGGPVIISADGNTLTNGSGGINLMQASQSLTMSNNVALNGPQPWQVGNNQTLSLQGGLFRNHGGAILFSSDGSPSAAGFIQTNIDGSVVTANNTVLADGAIGNSTGTGIPLGTYDDVDYAAINSTNEIVPGASIGYSTTYGIAGSFIYAANPNGNPPTEAGGSVTLFYDFTNTTSVGIRISTTTDLLGMRFNNEQTNTTYTYDGLPAWEIIFKTGNTLDPNSILVTTNDGPSPVVFTSGGFMRLSIGANEMEVFQNNPAAPLVIQSPITERSSGSDVAKYGPGLMDVQAACSYNAGTFIYGGTVKIDGAGGVGVGPVSVFSGGNFEAESGVGNAAPITVASGGTNTVFIAAANGQFNNGTNLTFNPGSTCLQFVYSNGIAPSATSAPLQMTVAGSALTLNGAVNVNIMGGNFTTGQFPLIKYSSLAGAGFAALNLNALPPEVQGYLSNNTANSSIDLVITSVGQPLTWDAGSDAWDIGQTADWLDALDNAVTYQQVLSSGESVIFNDSAPGPSITVTLDTNVIPTSVSVNNSVNNYTISGTGSIGGSAALTKTGTGTLTLGTANSFSGGLVLDGGTVNFSALANLGDSPIIFDGGTLQYNGNSDDISVRSVTFDAGGATIDVGSQNVTYAKAIGNGGPGGLTKLGSGTLTLNGDETYSGDTVVSQGILLLNTNTIIPDSPIITVDSGAVLDTATSGVNLALNTGQTLNGIGQVNGIVTAGASSTVEPAAAGVTGTLTIDGGLNIEDQSTVNMVVAPTSNDVIAVTGNLDVETGSSLNLNIIGGTLPIGRYVIMTYTGTLTGSPAGMAIYSNNSGTTVLSLDSSVSGQIALVVAAGARDNLVWSGSADYWGTGQGADWLNGGQAWIYTNGDSVTFDDSQSANTTIELMNNVEPSSVIVNNTANPTYTFADGSGTGNGLITGSASLTKEGTGTLIVQTANNYTGPTTISAGTLQVGNGGIGDAGLGNITNNAALIFQQGDGTTHYVPGIISGTGSLTVNANGATTVSLDGNNTYSGPTTITAGTLEVGTGTASGSLGSSSAVTNNGTLLLNRTGSFNFAYNVTGSGLLADDGLGTASLGAAVLSYLGDTSISNGVVKLGANNQLPNQDSVPGSVGILNLDGGVASAGTLDLDGFSATVNALSGAANTVNGSIINSSSSKTTTNTLTILSTASTTYSGQISDKGSSGAKTKLVVTGAGANANTLTLNPSGVNTFSGGMIISNSTVYLGSDANANSSEMAPGYGPITLLGTNTILVTDGGQSGANNSQSYPALTNNLNIPAGQIGTVYGPCRGNVGSALTGSGILNYETTYVRDGVSGDWSKFTGQIVLIGNSSGGNIGFTLANGLPDANVLMATDAVMYCEVSGATFPIGSLAGGDSTCQLESTNSGGGNGAQCTFAVGDLNTSTTYSGGIIDNLNMLKVGTGTWTLNCGGTLLTNTTIVGITPVTTIGYEANNVYYTGTTTVSNGVLALDAPVTLTNSSTVTLAAANATLDASDMGYISNLSVVLDNGATQEVFVTSTYEVVPGKTLAGIGTLNGFLQADAGSTFNVGLPTGTFNVTSNATLSGAITMSLNGAATPSSSELAAPSFTVNSTATLVVTNVGPNITNGVTFTLFNHPVTGFASVTLPETDSSGPVAYQWENNLATDGSITLTNGGVVVAPATPPPITFSLSGTNLKLSWPPAYLGYTLQAQTNSVATGLSTNWVDVAGSASGTNATISINPANGTVFYRLVQ